MAVSDLRRKLFWCIPRKINLASQPIAQRTQGKGQIGIRRVADDDQVNIAFRAFAFLRDGTVDEGDTNLAREWGQRLTQRLSDARRFRQDARKLVQDRTRWIGPVVNAVAVATAVENARARQLCQRSLQG